MLRLAPPNYLRFTQAGEYEAAFGGGEANVAVSIANFGMDAAFVTKLPKHKIGQATVNSLRKFGVDTSKITRNGDRAGIYFVRKAQAGVRSNSFTTERVPLSRGYLRGLLEGVRV
jgi:2-dehydro-3-deoxygluconokinase